MSKKTLISDKLEKDEVILGVQDIIGGYTVLITTRRVFRLIANAETLIELSVSGEKVDV